MAQASASKIRRRAREREQVARFLAPFIFDEELNLYEDDDGRWRIECPHCEPWPAEMQSSCIACRGSGSTAAEDALTLGLVVSPRPGDPRQRLAFDVHAAREATAALVRLEAEQEVFEDWTRSRGLGPENRELGAFVEPARESSVKVADPASGEQVAHSLAIALSEQHPDQGATAEGDRVTFGCKRSGGWPGKLAREWAWKRCPNKCERGPMAARYYESGPPGELDVCRECTDGRVRHRDPRAPMGRALARLGRRVLAAIEGQPSECLNKACHSGDVPRGRKVPVLGANGAVRYAPERWETCSHCQGSVHNLRGALTALEWPAVVRRNVRDAGSQTGDYDACAPWQSEIAMTMTDGDQVSATNTGQTHKTRVVPRGEHRIGPARGRDDPPWTLDQRINGRGWAPKSKREAAEDMRLIFACSPAWRRGEVRAQETRARRAWEAVGEEWEGQSWMPPRAAAGPEAAE